MPAIIICIFLCYFVEPWSIFDVGDFGVTAMKFAMLAYMLYVIKRLIWNGEKLKIAINPIFYSIIGMVLAAVISASYPLLLASRSMMGQFVKSSAHFLFFVSFGFLAFSYPIKRSLWNNGLKLWLGLSIPLNIFGVYQIVARAFDLPLAWLEFTNESLKNRGFFESIEDFSQLSLSFEKFFRATSIFTEPSHFALFNLFILILLLVPFINGSKPFFKSKFWTGLAAVCCIVATFLTFSLTAVLCIVLIMLCVYAFEKRKVFKETAIFLVIASVLVFTADYFVKDYAEISVLELFGQRIGGVLSGGNEHSGYTEGESVGYRMNTGRETIRAWYKSPITGIGLGNLHEITQGRVYFSDFGSFAALSEMGVFGFLAFSGLIGSVLWFSVKFLRDTDLASGLDDTTRRLLSTMFYFSVIFFQTNYITSNYLANNALWMPLGMVLSILNSSMIDLGKKYCTIGLLRAPLKDFFSAKNLVPTNIKE